MFSRLSPLPYPLPARSSRGEGEEEVPNVPSTFVAYPVDSSVCYSAGPLFGKWIVGHYGDGMDGFDVSPTLFTVMIE